MALPTNFAVSTVATAPSPATSGTSLVVQSGHGTRFWAPSTTLTGYSAVICPAADDPTPDNSEVVLVLAVSTDTLTITRAQQGSTARSVIVGDRIYAGPTAAHFSFGANTPPIAQPVPVSTPTSSATGAINTWYAVQVAIPCACTVTGIRYRVGTTGPQGNVKAALYSVTGGTRLAVATANLATATASTTQSVPFDAAVDIQTPTVIWALVWFSVATATWMGARTIVPTTTGTQATNPPLTITAPTAPEDADRPIITVY